MTATKIINVVKDDSFDEIFDLFKAATAEEVIFILPKKSKALNNEEHFALIKAHALEQGKKISVMSSNPAVATLARQHEFEVLSNGSASAVKPKKRTAEKPEAVLAVVREDSDLLDPLTPSDEIMGIPDPEDEEEDDLEPVKEEAEDIDGDLVEEKPEAEKEEDADELEDEEEEVEDEIEEDEELDEELEEEEPKEEELEEIAEDTELTSEEFVEQPVADLAKARKLDGMIHASTGPGKNLRVHAKDNKMVKLGIKKSKVKSEDLEEMAQVWQQEPYNNGESMWTGILKEQEGKPSALSNFFSRKKEVNLNRSLPHYEAKSGGHSRKIVAAVVLVGLLAGGFVYVKAGSAEIVITPVSKKLDFDLSASVSDQYSAVDATFNKIPGQLFLIEKTAAQEFPSTGLREVAQKARGTIKVYNTFGSTPQTLIATTRFETPSGLIFRTLRTVMVPGMTVSNGATSPGSIDVEVIADKAGESYNVPAGRFGVSAFKEKGDTARYEKIYGQSTAAMKDGMSGNAKVVTQQDYDRAKDAVTQKLKEEIAKALEQEASGLKIAESAPMQITSTSTSTEVDQAANTFTVTMKGQLKTMGFKEPDSWNLLRQYVEKTHGVTIVPGKLEVQYEEALLNETTGVLELKMKVDGKGYGQINNDRIISDLLGKGQDDIVGYLKSADGVAEAKVLLTPFWVKKVPKNKEKVTIQLDYQ